MQERTAREWVVMKFGGTSVSSARCWETICEQAKEHLDAGKHVFFVDVDPDQESALNEITKAHPRLQQAGDDCTPNDGTFRREDAR